MPGAVALHPAQDLDLAVGAGRECGHAGFGRQHHGAARMRDAHRRAQAGARADHQRRAGFGRGHAWGEQARVGRIQPLGAMRRGGEIVDDVQLVQAQGVAQVLQRDPPGQVGIDDLAIQHHASAGDGHALERGARLAGIQLAIGEVGQDRGQAGVLPAGIAAIVEDLDALAVGLHQRDARIGATDVGSDEARHGRDRRGREHGLRPQCDHLRFSPDACRIAHPNIPMPVRRGECAAV